MEAAAKAAQEEAKRKADEKTERQVCNFRASSSSVHSAGGFCQSRSRARDYIESVRRGADRTSAIAAGARTTTTVI
jgi:hypothetical protein